MENEVIETQKTSVERLGNTPVDIVRLNENSFLKLGNYRISKEFDNEKELQKYLKNNDVELITNIVGTILEAYNLKNEKNAK